MPDFSDVPFAAALAYHTAPTTAAEQQSKNSMFELKQDKVGPSRGGVTAKPFSRRVAEGLREAVWLETVRDFFGSGATLVPIPGHGISGGDRALWVPKRVADALVEAGFGDSCEPVLRRRHAVRKSAFAGPRDRPSPLEHFESLETNLGLRRPSRVILVDDVLTKGSTALGAAARIRDSLPDVEVSMFAVMRAPRWDQFKGLRDPARGVIRLSESGLPEVVVLSL